MSTRSSIPPTDPSCATDEQADRIVATALVVFGSRGYHDTTLEEIARRAGVSLTILREHFPTKDEVFREVVRTTLLGNLPVQASDRDAADDVSSPDAIRALARRYWTTMERPELAAIVRLIVAELPRFPELAVFHATEALERFVHTVERVIERGIARGELRPIDVRSAARTILATLAAHALWFAHPSIYGGIIGSDRERAASSTIETLIRTLGPISAPGPAAAPDET